MSFQVATNIYSFMPTELGLMMSLSFLVRAIFLTLLFPVIISVGRRFLTPKPTSPTSSSSSSITLPVEGTQPGSSGLSKHQHLAEYSTRPEEDGPEDIQWEQPVDILHGATFDLRFLKASLFLDGLLTGCCLLISKGWHVYLGESSINPPLKSILEDADDLNCLSAAVLLPLASGTGSASKGVILEMVTPEERSDALASIALLERAATIASIGIFGQIVRALLSVSHLRRFDSESLTCPLSVAFSSQP